MVNLIVDNGNSFTKIAIFESSKLVGFEKLEKITIESFEDIFRKIIVQNCILSSVADFPGEYVKYLSLKTNFIQFTHQTPIPIKNTYATPETLGLDRLAAACGAFSLFPEEDCLIIDAGTCLTYDFVNKNAEYNGGAISPGLTMRYRALHTFTNKLPLVQFMQEKVDVMGKTTQDAIRSGVQNGILMEVERMIQWYKERYPALKTIICGGDAKFFDTHLKNTIFAEPNLVLVGLNSILNYNHGSN